MKLGGLIAIGLVLLVVVLGGWLRGAYNGLVQGDEGVKTAWAQVENVLQRRLDLIPNLVETVKGYAAHERETLEAVVNARSRVAGAGTPEESIEANNQLSGALSRLLVVVERYPDLKANQNFLALQDELAGTENRISTERKRYNDVVQTYNVRRRSFPNNLVAGMFGFEAARLFDAPPEASQAPRVSFGQPATTPATGSGN